MASRKGGGYIPFGSLIDIRVVEAKALGKDGAKFVKGGCRQFNCAKKYATASSLSVTAAIKKRKTA